MMTAPVALRDFTQEEVKNRLVDLFENSEGNSYPRLISPMFKSILTKVGI